MLILRHQPRRDQRAAFQRWSLRLGICAWEARGGLAKAASSWGAPALSLEDSGDS